MVVFQDPVYHPAKYPTSSAPAFNRAGLAQSRATKAVLFPISENTKKSMALIAGAGGRLRGNKSTWRKYSYW